MHQHIDEWTRSRSGQLLSTLDYVFTDESNVIDDISYTTALGKSDHVCIELNYIKEQPDVEATHTTYDFWKGDYVRIREDLQKTDWDLLLSNKGVDEAWTCFHSRIPTLIESYVHLQKVSGGKVRKKNEWMTKATINEIKKERCPLVYRTLGPETAWAMSIWFSYVYTVTLRYQDKSARPTSTQMTVSDGEQHGSLWTWD